MNFFNQIPEIKLSCTGDISAITAAVAEKLSASESSHDLDHTIRVMHNAELLLAHTPGVDADIVRLSALLHDIARPEEDAGKGSCCHAELGAKLAMEILLSAAVPHPVAAAVSRAIACHRFRRGAVPNFIEAQILYDADKLDSLGAVGLGRAFLFAGHCNARLHNTEAEALSSEPYSKEDTAFREYLVKLRHVPEKMFTAEGKKIAVSRLQFMETFFSTLDSEING